MRILIVFILIAFIQKAHAQLISDNFESYELGEFDSQMNGTEWEGWVGEFSNSSIVDEQFYQGEKSLRVDENDDVVALLGNINSDVYEIIFWEFVPANYGSYSNLQYDYESIPLGGNWMTEVYIRQDGSAVFQTDGNEIDFVAIHNQWVEHKYHLDFSTAAGEFYYNDILVSDFAIDTDVGGGPGLNQVNAINFFGNCGDNCNSLAYYDDISISFIPDFSFDARIISTMQPTEYTIVPSGLDQPLLLEVQIANRGSEPLTDVQVLFTVYDELNNIVHSSVSDQFSSVSSNALINVSAKETFTLEQTGAYTIEYEVTMNETDEDDGNNSLTTELDYVTDPNRYSRDNGIYENGIGINNGSGIIGQSFYFSKASTIRGMDFYYSGGAVGEIVKAHIYEVDQSGIPSSLYASSESVEILEEGTLGDEIFISIDFATPIEIEASTYLFAIEQEGTTNISIATSNSIFTPRKSWFTLDNVTWENLEDFNISVALAIRPFINSIQVSAVEIESLKSDIIITPNPTTGFISIIRMDMNGDNSACTIVDSQGKIMQNIPIGNNKVLNVDLSHLRKGIYFLRIQNGEKTNTQKIIIQ